MTCGNPPLVEVIEALLGKGYEMKLIDRNVNLAALTGANKDYILNHIPHISRLMVDSMQEVLEFAEVIVIGNGAAEFKTVLDELRPGQVVVDLVRVVRTRVKRDDTMAFAGKPKRVLIIVENLPSPFDRRVWQEATTLCEAGYEVSIICPTGKGYEKKYEVIDGIHIYRHNLPLEAVGGNWLCGGIFCRAFLGIFTLALKVLFTRGFDVIHVCNPLSPTLFLSLVDSSSCFSVKSFFSITTTLIRVIRGQVW